MAGIASGLYTLFGPNPVAKAAASAGQNEFTAEGQAVGGIKSALDTGATNVNAATGQGNTQLQGYLNGLNQNTAAGVQSGIQGNTSLQQYAASNPQFHFDPTQQELENTPGYKFQLQQGTNAITNQAAAQGLSQGGSTLAALTQYGQGLAGTYYQNAFNNAQSQFQTNQNTTLANLSTLIGAGNQANTQQLAATTALGAPQASNTIDSQKYLAGLGLQGSETQGKDILDAVNTAGNFGLEGAGAKAAQNIGGIGQIIGGVAGLAGGF